MAGDDKEERGNPTPRRMLSRGRRQLDHTTKCTGYWLVIGHFCLDRGADIQVWNGNWHGLLSPRHTDRNKWNWTPLMIAEGHRPGNFRPSPETIAAIGRVFQAAGVPRPPRVKADNRPDYGG